MAGGRVVQGRAMIVDVGAKLRRIAKDRFELGGGRGLVGLGEGGRRKRGRRGGEKLDGKRERGEERGQGRAKRREAAPRAPAPEGECPAPEAQLKRPPMPHSLSRTAC